MDRAAFEALMQLARAASGRADDPIRVGPTRARGCDKATRHLAAALTDTRAANTRPLQPPSSLLPPCF